MKNLSVDEDQEETQTQHRRTVEVCCPSFDEMKKQMAVLFGDSVESSDQEEGSAVLPSIAKNRSRDNSKKKVQKVM